MSLFTFDGTPSHAAVHAESELSYYAAPFGSKTHIVVVAGPSAHNEYSLSERSVIVWRPLPECRNVKCVNGTVENESTAW